MRKPVSLVLLTFAGLAVCSATTVQQLQQKLSRARGNDAELAQSIAMDDLSERVGSAELSSMLAELPGPLSRQALLAVADRSDFLPPPRREIPHIAPPSSQDQAAMVARLDKYIVSTLPTLPDFVATRRVIRYQDRLKPMDFQNSGTGLGRPLRVASESTSQVIYRPRGGDEGAAAAQADAAHGGLHTQGAFGTVLATVLKDTTEARMKWERWEQEADGNKAVFRFSVSQKQSHYQVTYCCVPRVDPRVDAKGVFSERTGYHGEIEIDPATGAIHRLTLIADLGLRRPISDADLTVVYGHVNIGGKIYDCPLKSVTITRAQLGSFAVYTQNWPITMLTDTVFSNYQRFRGDLRILPHSN